MKYLRLKFKEGRAMLPLSEIDHLMIADFPTPETIVVAKSRLKFPFDVIEFVTDDCFTYNIDGIPKIKIVDSPWVAHNVKDQGDYLLRT